MYPTKAEINGKIYGLNTDYKVALECFKIVNDEDICDEERAMAIVYKLFGFIPDDLYPFLEKAKKFLEGENHPNVDTSNSQPDMDFDYDRAYIQASFMSDYHIDISNSNMHFWQYIELIEGLTPDCVLSRVRELRNYDLSEVKDRKTREKIKKSQLLLALPEHITKEEQKLIDEFESLFS